MLSTWLPAFAFTQLVEAPIYAHALRTDRERDPSLPWPRALALGLLPSTVTHPVVWFGFPALLPEADYWVMVAAAETFAVLVEAALMKTLGLRRAMLWALFANALSLGLGLFVRLTTGLT